MVGTILIAIVLLVFLIMNGHVQGQSTFRDKGIFVLSCVVFSFSLLLAFDISLEGIIQFLNNFFGTLTKMVVHV
jgi:hypothetical protein